MNGKSATRAEFVSIFFGVLSASSRAIMNDIADGAIPDVGMMSMPRIYVFYLADILTGSDALGTLKSDTGIKRGEVAAIITRMFDETARKNITL